MESADKKPDGDEGVGLNNKDGGKTQVLSGSSGKKTDDLCLTQNSEKQTTDGASVQREATEGQEVDKPEVEPGQTHIKVNVKEVLGSSNSGSSELDDGRSSEGSKVNSSNSQVVPAVGDDSDVGGGGQSLAESVDTQKLKDVKMEASRILEERESTDNEKTPALRQNGLPDVPTPVNVKLDKRRIGATTFYGSHGRTPYFRSAHAHIQCLQPPQAVPGSVHLSRTKLPPSLIRLATVTMAPKVKCSTPPVTSLYYEEPRRPRKVITWDQAHNARPPLRFDMEGPTPWSYSPRNKPLNETNAPSWTFGSKCSPERDGGSRTSWGKTWFQTPHIWHTKVDFISDTRWPSPNAYVKSSLLGPRQRTMPEYPAFSMGRKGEFTYVKPGAEKEPSPLDYDKTTADRVMYRSTPSFTHQFRREGTILWSPGENTPGPGAYSPTTSCNHPHNPAFSIKGIRGEKSHVLGPYSTF